MANKNLFITRPSHDETTIYCKKWSEKIIKTCKKMNIDVIDLKDEKVTRKNVESYLKKRTPDLLCLMVMVVMIEYVVAAEMKS